MMLMMTIILEVSNSQMSPSGLSKKNEGKRLCILLAKNSHELFLKKIKKINLIEYFV
jgi:hypothetical protein